MSSNRHCAISIDLDPLTAYYAIHGLGAPPSKLRFTILNNALPRFETLFAELDVRATFFVVGRDLEQSADARLLLRRLVDAGHEIANHTYSHPYDLCRLSSLAIDEEIRRAHQLIVEHLGKDAAPVGFRSPGYFVNGKVLRALTALKYHYDSSMFPSPPYYLAKAAVMAAMALRGRTSASVLSDPRGQFSPSDPYVPDLDQPWRPGTSSLMELPVAVIPWLRLPAIGTSLAVSPPWLRRTLLRGMSDRPLFNLELHGIDLSDAVADRIPTELAGRQPDLRVPVGEKRRVFADLIEALKGTRDFVTLRESAQIYSPRA